ncbi:malonyl-ACP O-methyltransferase BioC [Shewanella avicenniae]|uniref:malonyl-[acyl-carrier protein] O-methyltransferase n=1 Tax=Shewanella avicenniae TaxID=2814294 RepID=A0ABX7QNP9_9GAMM|nr:malonyl-ACP O-methyltransferase BioC [Shewanella avicenniae]QSX32375.1 malonyl-ACP O-methyltransferase BioC [Shewanella avicenniae]
MSTPKPQAATELVAQRFSQAARQYQQHDVVQRQTRRRLLEMLQAPVGRLLDVGAGPGTDFYQLKPNQVVAVDIAQGMLAQLSQSYTDYLALAGDAIKLPLLDASVDCYFSNLALQWCDNLAQVAAEAYRVLRPNGQLAVAVVIADSLLELRQLGLQRRTFVELESWQKAFGSQAWQVLSVSCETHQCFFNDLRSLLYSIKGVGASSVTESSGLRGKRHWTRLQQQAELMRQPQGLPLSYQVLYITARK